MLPEERQGPCVVVKGRGPGNVNDIGEELYEEGSVGVPVEGVVEELRR